jgi:hypothetical protein
LQLIDIVLQFFLYGLCCGLVDAYRKRLDFPEVDVDFIFLELCHDLLVGFDVVDDLVESRRAVGAAGGLDQVEQSSAEGHGVLPQGSFLELVVGEFADARFVLADELHECLVVVGQFFAF